MVDVSHAVLRLHSINLRGIMYIVAEEINGLAGGVNFSLIDVLALAQHTSGIHYGAVLRGEQFSHLQHDGGTCGPRRTAPLLPSFHCSLDGELHFLLAHFMISSEDMFVVVRAGHSTGVSGADFLATDDDGDIDHDVRLTFKFSFEGYALGRACEISLYRLIGRNGKRKN